MNLQPTQPSVGKNTQYLSNNNFNINDTCLIKLKSLTLSKFSFPTQHLYCSPYLLPKSTQFYIYFYNFTQWYLKFFQKILSLTFPLLLQFLRQSNSKNNESFLEQSLKNLYKWRKSIGEKAAGSYRIAAT